MSPGFSLAAVLRIRRIQEEIAAADVATNRARTWRAFSDHARREALLDGRPAPGTEESSRWLASIAANLALAADAHAARLALLAAEDETAAAVDSWSRAATAVKGIEHLADRYDEEVRREQARREQRAADDRAGADHRRRHPRPGATS